jgi:hypothetical protein
LETPNYQTRYDARDHDWLTSVGTRVFDAIQAPFQLLRLALRLRQLQREDGPLERQYDEQRTAG